MPGIEVKFPNGKRIAVIISVLFETWSEKKGPAYFPRTTAMKPGSTDYGAIQWGQYAGTEGAWRIIRVLDRHNRRASFFSSGRSAELYPEVFKQLTKSGHITEGHGYVQNEHFFEMQPEQQHAKIKHTLDLLEAASGSRPEGWATPIYGWDGNTFDLLVKEGIKYYADALDISLPRKESTNSGSIVALPWSDFVDNRVLRGDPRSYLDVYVDTFDYLLKHEAGGLLNIAIHAHFGGRPLVIAQFVKLLEYLSRFESEAWFPTHRELVNWFTEQNVVGMDYQKRFFD